MSNRDETALGENAHGTIFGNFRSAAERWPKHAFLHTPAEALAGEAEIALTFEEAMADVQALQARYAEAGFGHGHRAGLALDNHPEFFLHFLALNALGVSIAPLNLAMSDSELQQTVSLAELDLMVCRERYTERLAGLTPTTMPLVSAADTTVAPAGRPALPGIPHAESEAAMIFTSGTTGTPKGCVLSNAYFTRIGAFYTELGGYCAFRPGADRILTPLPVTHMNALACSFMAAIFSGGCLIQLDRFHASTWWRTVRETRATIVHYLGVMPAILLQRDDEPAAWEGHSIRFAFGAGVDPRHHAIFEERYGFPLIEAWAMSETGAGAWITASEEPRHVGQRCFGKAPDHMEYRLVDEEGRDVAAGRPGELLVRARGDDPRRHFFSRYHNDEAATEAAWDGGWLHTGDIVRRDEKGSLFFVDRSKNIVRRSGENIAAVEVEGALMRHDAVTGCAVTPVPDEIRGEEVLALIETSGTADETLAADIARSCLESLQYFKIPGYLAFVDALPTTSSQKLQRGEIRKLGRAIVEQGGAFDLRALKRKQA
ncbi:ATP-dependent acyl-CoA ligase [Novosphingobium sp. P6W]|nr:ATP-dependent acyl-CoA ligase [Novosphingobium sp. P6W]